MSVRHTNGVVALPRTGDADLRFVAVNLSLLGDTVLVTGTARKRVRLVLLYVSAALAVSLGIKSDTTVLVPPMPLGVGVVQLTALPNGWLAQTAVGQDLVLSLSGAVAVTGAALYIVV